MATPQEVITKCSTLQKFWAPRTAKFKAWYKVLQMTDTLAQKGMESFVGNDPRASFNLILNMLDQKIPHRIPPEQLSLEQIAPANELAKTCEIAWRDIAQQYRARGRYFSRDLASLILATGWYSVFAIVSQDGTRCVAEVFNPATVFQAWDDRLSECAHIFTASESQTKRMFARNNWKGTPPRGDTKFYDLWEDDGSVVANSIVAGNLLVKDTLVEPRLKRIPIFTGPVGGLPDTGLIISGSQKWKAEIGQSLIATNENVYKYMNKFWTFLLQILRDTAQAKSYEKSASGKEIVKKGEWNRRGAHFKMGVQDEVGFVNPPPLPLELRSSQLDMEAMAQRGGPSWAMFGNIQQQLTAYVMSQISASANQITKPFHQGIIDCITDIDNFFLQLVKDNKYKIYDRDYPEGLPEDAMLTAKYELRIPGDLIQRVTTARIMNPAFELSDEKIMEDLFPEIKSPSEELAKVQAGKARRHPVNAQIALIESFKQEAALLRKAGDLEAAKMYEKAAALVEASMSLPQPPQPEAAGGVRPPGVRPEVSPPPSPMEPV